MVQNISYKNGLEVLSVFLKAVAGLVGMAAIFGVFFGAPFMLKQYSFANQVSILIICLFVGPLYLLPNSYLLKNKLNIFIFIVVSSFFIILGGVEIFLELRNNSIVFYKIVIWALACTSAPASLYIYWKLKTGRQ